LHRLEDAKCDVSIVGSLSDLYVMLWSVLIVWEATGIATGYELGGLEIEFGWAKDFPYRSRPSLVYNGYQIFWGVKWPRGVGKTVSSNTIINGNRDKNKELLWYIIC